MTATGERPSRRKWVVENTAAGEFLFADKKTARRLLERTGHLQEIAAGQDAPTMPTHSQPWT